MRFDFRQCCAMVIGAVAGTASAGVITTFSDASLTGAAIDNFSSYAVGTPTSVGNDVFTMTQNGGGTLNVTDDFDGTFGTTGRSVVSFSGAGVTLTFSQSLSAFAVLIGAADFSWNVEAEAFDVGGGSLGSATVTRAVNGFVVGWSGAGIGSVKLSPTSSDAVVFDDLHYVVQNTNVPEPASLALVGSALLGLCLTRRRKA